jgi:hypothetical protein
MSSSVPSAAATLGYGILGAQNEHFPGSLFNFIGITSLILVALWLLSIYRDALHTRLLKFGITSETVVRMDGLTALGTEIQHISRGHLEALVVSHSQFDVSRVERIHAPFHTLHKTVCTYIYR